MDAITRIIHPLHREGYPFVLIFAVVTLIFFAMSDTLGWIGVILTLWCVYFFRDPARVVPQGDGLVVSPGDGLITAIEQVPLPRELELENSGTRTRISIFLNVLNVHVNRIPIKGRINKLYYHQGKFLNASLDKASEENERQIIHITRDDGKDLACVQIAGLIARRIVCNLQPQQLVETGERFGIIRFGSRVDVYLPEGVQPLVSVGQTALGGETVLADLSRIYPAQTGITR